MSFRERIMEVLLNTNEPLTAEQIAVMAGLDPSQSREVYEHLRHIAKTVRAKYGKVLYMQPAECRKCGYVFNSDKPKKPSKCPRCGSTWIEPPRFIIK